MAALAISVEGLGKRYRIAHQRAPYGRLTESVSNAIRGPFDRLRGKHEATSELIWALQNVTFDVGSGQVLGVIGRNGAGKSTLLKILSRITDPTTGMAKLRGRVGSLLEVGTGFHPELTGRENIFLSGSILGMRRAEIASKFDEIVAFAEVEQFLDVPIKRYSSGMSVRLGFAVAAHLETEILIVDEVLAVGDIGFQRKSLARMDEISHDGRTVIFVSHSMPAIERLCDSVLLLDQGRIIEAGDAKTVVDRYFAIAGAARSESLASRQDREGDGRLRFVGVEASLRTGQPSELRLHYKGISPLTNVAVSIGLFTARGEGAAFLGNVVSGFDLGALPARGVLVCKLDPAALMPGAYSLNVHCLVNGELADWVIDAASLEVAEGDFFGTGRLPPVGYGSVAVQQAWVVEPA